MQFLFDYGLFFAKFATILAGLLILVGGIFTIGHRRPREADGHIEVKDLNERFDSFEDDIKHSILFEDELKSLLKEQRKQDKLEEKQRKKHKKEEPPRKRIFVLDFDGDIKASAVENLREEITAILTLAKPDEEVLVKLESSGGMVHSYGLAASQLQRLVNAGLKLTVSVDRVAASGGYMMACIAQTIVAAPFAIIGSIGVMAQLPNFHRLLKKHDVDIELHTAGEFKRTLTVLGENTEKGRHKFLEELEDTHILFKQFVSEHRPQLIIDEVATGEVWYGTQAIANKLVDGIQTSDEFLLARRKDNDLFLVQYVEKKPWQEKLGLMAEASIERVVERMIHKLGTRFFW
ncbi:MAG: ClpP class periplasmic serine protease [Verrucomicrobiaceae bacterium]|nr:ClpP class periplasmic serine protease [Verrucomicrobiaceae bacterium]